MVASWHLSMNSDHGEKVVAWWTWPLLWRGYPCWSAQASDRLRISSMGFQTQWYTGVGLGKAFLGRRLPCSDTQQTSRQWEGLVAFSYLSPNNSSFNSSLETCLSKNGSAARVNQNLNCPPLDLPGKKIDGTIICFFLFAESPLDD